jgi:hypothetical protein
MKAILTRRTVLLGAGAATLAGGAWVVTTKAADLLIPFFQKNLPGVTLDLPSTRLAIEDCLFCHYDERAATNRGGGLARLRGPGRAQIS